MNQCACLLLATLVAACPSVQFSVEHLDSISRAPAMDGVHVYYNPGGIRQPYQAIGLITLNYEKNGQWNSVSRDEIDRQGHPSRSGERRRSPHSSSLPTATQRSCLDAGSCDCLKLTRAGRERDNG